MEDNQTCRPPFLVASLAAASSVFAYRLGGVLNEFLFMLIRRVPVNAVQWLCGWEVHLGLVLGLLLAMLCAIWQHSLLKVKSPKTNRIFLAVFVILAVLPLQFRIKAVVPVELPPETFAPTGNASPAIIVCKLIDGEKIENAAVLNNSHFAKAEPHSWDAKSYQIRLFLRSEGRQVVEKVTSRNVGKRLGFWIDGDLKCSPEIKAPITQEFIMLPLDMSFAEASRLAAGIMKKGS